MKTIKSVLPKAGMIFLIFTLLCGVIYTGVVTGIAQLIFSDNANGSIIEVDGKKYGCELLGQQYTDESHMWGRIMNIDVSTYTDENGKALMYAPHHGSRFLVDQPVVFVLRVFLIAVDGTVGGGLAGFPFDPNGRFLLAAQVTQIPLVHDIEEGRKFVAVLVVAVHAVGNGNV